MFEITFVDHDDPFYQVQNRPTFRLSCRTFEYSSEIIDTDIKDLFNYADNNTKIISILKYAYSNRDNLDKAIELISEICTEKELKLIL